MSVVPLRVKLVVPSLLVALCIISLTNTVMVSVVVLRFVNVNSVVDPSPLKLSVVICSNIMLNGSRCVVVPNSNMIASSVKLESSSVPVSHWIPPTTILMKPTADSTSVSALTGVKVMDSPTSYF